MKTLLSTILITYISLNVAISQSHFHNGIPCGYEHGIKSMENKFPGFKNAVELSFKYAQINSENTQHLRTTYTIPVIIHIVWKNPIENIDSATIIEQINILNQDYQKLNPDTSNLRNIFLSVSGNPQINFRLDSIIRIQTNEVFYSTGIIPDMSITDRVKQDCFGGSAPFDTEKFLNIWICNLGSSGILGFAYPPANLSNWPSGAEAPSKGLEGVVLDYRVVGASGSITQGNTTIITQGRTATHEIGHYLGLRHIWGDGLLTFLGIPNCTDDDGISDTPNAGLNANFICDTLVNTCDTAQLGDLPDMIENFMDYASEDCMNTFTIGQSNLMRGLLGTGGTRNGLILNSNFISPPNNDNISQANLLQVQTNNNCLNYTSTSTVGANPSYLNGCGSASDHDIWFRFEAISSDINLEITNVLTVSGMNSTLVYELFEDDCQNLNSLLCGTGTDTTFSNLINGNTYLLRIYSNDSLASHNFDICLSSNPSVNIQNINDENITIYPNPANETLRIKMPPFHKTTKISIHNLWGVQVLHELIVPSNSIEFAIDTKKLPSGVYFLKITRSNKDLYKKIKLIK